MLYRMSMWLLKKTRFMMFMMFCLNLLANA